MQMTNKLMFDNY